MYKFLIIENDQLWALTLSSLINKMGKVSIVDNEASAILALERQTFDLVFIDLDLQKQKGGLDLLKKINSNQTYSVIISGNDDKETITQGYELGCRDYLVKPVTKQAIENLLERFKNSKMKHQIDRLIEEKFITLDPATKNTLQLLKNINLSNKAILLTGESGTGKSSLAKIIHQITSEKAPFVSLNCSQFNDSTLESELFGHVKGSFTGALNNKVGLITKAECGILFLDEIHSLSTKAQQKLLTAIETGVIYPLGSETPIKVNFRVICATCENLEELIEKGQFRKDLYFRIKTFVLHINSLNQRKCDILPLFDFYLAKKERRIVLTKEVENALINYHWPANIREIEDLIENWHTQGIGLIKIEDLPSHISKIETKEIQLVSDSFLTNEQMNLLNTLGLKDFLELMKAKSIDAILEKHKGKQISAANELKVSKSFISKFQSKILEDSHGQQLQ